MPEKLIVGDISEDKKPQFQFLNSKKEPILLASLIGYGVIIYAPNDEIIKKFGVNIEGFDNTKVQTIDSSTIEIILEGIIMPVIEGKITARTVIKFKDNDFNNDFRIDYSEERQLIYIAEKI